MKIAHVGVVTAHVRVVTAHVGVVTAHVGVVTAHVGLATAHVGVATAHVGPATAHVAPHIRVCATPAATNITSKLRISPSQLERVPVARGNSPTNKSLDNRFNII